MHKIITLPIFILFLILGSCGGNKTKYSSYGDIIDDKNPHDITSLASIDIENEKHMKLTGTVNEVCQAKGCWMTLKNEDGIPVRVTFRDYGFFVPKDIAGQQVIVDGIISKKELSQKMARHYAEDANTAFDSTKTYLEYAFIADGVLVAMTNNSN